MFRELPTREDVSRRKHAIKCTHVLIIIPIQPITSLYDSNIKDYCKDRNVVIVGLPAAFTPT